MLTMPNRIFVALFAIPVLLLSTHSLAMTSEECRGRYQEMMEVVNDPLAPKPREAAEQAKSLLDSCLSNVAIDAQMKADTPPSGNSQPGGPWIPDKRVSREKEQDREAPRPIHQKRGADLIRELSRAHALMSGIGSKFDSDAGYKIYDEVDPRTEEIHAAAAKADPDAMIFLGWELIKGDRVERDHQRGIAMLLQAAKAENPVAHFTLALALHLDQLGGAKVDGVRVGQWMKRAADRGHVRAKSIYGSMLWTGTDVDRDRRQAARYFEAAASRGDAEANFNMAIAHMAQADGMPIEPLKAMEHIDAAIAGNYDKAPALKKRIRLQAAGIVAKAVAATGMAPIRTKADFATYFGSCGSSVQIRELLPQALRSAPTVCVATDLKRCAQDLGVQRCGTAHFGFDDEGNTVWAYFNTAVSGANFKVSDALFRAYGRKEPSSSQTGQFLKSTFMWLMPGYKVEHHSFYELPGRSAEGSFDMTWVVLN